MTQHALAEAVGARVSEATELLGFPVETVIDDHETPPRIRRSAVPL